MELPEEDSQQTDLFVDEAALALKAPRIFKDFLDMVVRQTKYGECMRQVALMGVRDGKPRIVVWLKRDPGTIKMRFGDKHLDPLREDFMELPVVIVKEYKD